MSDVQQIIERAKRLVQLGAGAPQGEVAEVATAFAARCRDVNSRLARCAEYLRGGLLGEAIHLAEVPPRVLDVVGVLDFERQNEWRQLVEHVGVEPLPHLSLDVADALNQAYAQYQPIEESVRKYRLLSLARAPLPRRIGVLREIARRFPGTFWEEDLEELERARFEEMRGAVERARQEHDLTLLREFEDELALEAWRTSPPKALVNAVDTAFKQLVHADARTRLWELIAPLNAALASFDVPRGRELRTLWQRIVQESGFNPPFLDDVSEAFQWLQDEDQKEARERACQTALADLEAAVDGPQLTLAELDRAAQEVHRFERELPRHLATRVAARRDDLTGRRTLHHRLILLGTGGALTAALVLLTWVIVSRGRIRHIQEIAGAVDQMLAASQFNEADQLLKAQLPVRSWMAKDPRALQIQSKVQEASEKDARRATKFREAMADLKQAAIEESHPGAMSRAEDLARTDEERKELGLAKQERTQLQLELEQKKAERFDQRVQEISKKVQELEQIPHRMDQERRAAQLIGEIESSIRGLPSDQPRAANLDQAMYRAIAALEIRTRTARTAWEQTRLRATLDGTITAAVGNIETFRDRLLEATVKLPAAPRNADFQEALKEYRFWETHLKWETILRPWRAVPTPYDPTAAELRVKECQQFLLANAAAPDAEAIRKYLTCIEPIAKRAGDTGAEASLRKLFTGPLMKGLWVIRLKNGEKVETYYFKSDPTKNTSEMPTLGFIVNFSLAEQRKLFKRSEVVMAKEAPQCALAEEALKRLKQIKHNDWEDTIQGLALMVQKERELEPLLQLAVLRQVLRHGSAGSQPLELATRSFFDELRKVEIDTDVTWMDPQNSKADTEREAARKFVVSFPLNRLSADAARYQANAGPVLERERKWAGWLTQSDNEWECTFAKPPTEAGTLWIIVPQSAEASEWVQIGEWNDDHCTIHPVQDGKLKQGRPVYVMQSKSNADR